MALVGFNHPFVDNSHLPVSICRIADGMSDAQVQKFQSDIEAWTFATREPYAWVMILPEHSSPSSRKIVAESRKKRFVHEARYMVCQAYVVTRPLVRNFLTAIMWLSKQPSPYQIFATEDEALVWAQTMVRRPKQADLKNVG